MRNDKGIVVVIEGPSGVGKDTLINELIASNPQLFEKVISVTTRAMREGESQGNPYDFVSNAEFEDMLNRNEIFEHTTRHGTYRGMRKNNFDKIINAKKIPLKDCDEIGLDALKKLYPGKVFSIFITAPKEHIHARLINRGDDDNSIRVRMQDYDDKMSKTKYYDKVVQNIELQTATNEVLDHIRTFYERV